MTGLLPPQLLPAVRHVVFGIFNLAIPNILAWLAIAVVFMVGSFLRLPSFFEPHSEKESDTP